MAAPITWQNINGPDLGQASRGMFLAQQAFNQGFDKIGDVLKSREAVDVANWDAQKANNTAAFMQQMRQYQTPEALAAAQASGALDPSRFQAQIDQPAVGTALDARPGFLADQGTKLNTFSDQTTDRRQLPFVQAAQALYAQGKTAEGDAILAANESPRLPAVLAASSMAGSRALTADKTAAADAGYKVKQEARAVTAEARAVLKQESDLATAQTDRVYKEALSAQALADSNTKNFALRVDTRRKADLSAAIKDGVYGAGNYETADGQKATITGLKNLGFKDAQIADATAELGKQFPKGIPITGKDGKTSYVSLPVNFILEHAARSEDNALAFPSMGWSRRGDNLTNLMSESLKDPAVIKDLQAAEAMKNELLFAPLAKPINPSGNSPSLMLDSVLQKARERAMTPTQRAAADAEAQKKSPELAGNAVPPSPGTAALPVNRAVETHPDSKVTSTIGFSMGNPGIPSKPVDTSNTTWGKAQEVVSAGVASRKAAGTKAFVLTVGDGDSLDLSGTPSGPKNLTCRLDAIDAPETAKSFTKPAQPGQPYGQEALDTLKKLVANKEVTVTVTKPISDGSKSAANNYGRALCQIDVQGKDVNSEMLSAGSAWLYEQFGDETPLKAARRELQNAAIANKAGIHGLAPQQKPWDYRREQNRLK